MTCKVHQSSHRLSFLIKPQSPHDPSSQSDTGRIEHNRSDVPTRNVEGEDESLRNQESGGKPMNAEFGYGKSLVPHGGHLRHRDVSKKAVYPVAQRPHDWAMHQI